MSLLAWTYLIAALTAVACSLAGVMLVVKREALVSEGLSHAVLPGIVLAFLIFRDRSSPLLILAAGLSGLLMVWLVQWIARTGRVKQDAALGIVFSGMFSVGVIASSLNLKNVHFHAHCIIDGNLAFAALDDCHWFGVYLGPKAFVSMMLCVVGVVGFVVVFFKELKLMAFDETTSHLFGFRPRLLHTIWLAIVSIVAVAAFEVAGTILVVALMIAPAAAANLLSDRLSWMFVLSALLGVVAALLGVALSQPLSISPAGPISSIAGFLFLLIVFFAPKRGLIARRIARRRRRSLWIALLAKRNRLPKNE
jgi:manganese/zinc/iron transport system permease protein